jgi:hypothetical protein
MKGWARPFLSRNPSQGTPMEAERLNQIASLIADLRERSAELRRYL